MPLADAGLRRGEWLKKQLKGFELFGKTMGIIGMGRIGAHVASRAAAFGMLCLGYDPLIPNDEIAKRGAQPAELNNLLNRSDILTLHVPLTHETRGLINAERITQMKSGACIVCTARGGVIDEPALTEALRAGELTGAGLDVLEHEPPPADHPLLHMDNVIVTPHVGWYSEEAARDVIVGAFAQVADILRAAAHSENRS